MYIRCSIYFKNQCPSDNVRIIAHSLGSRVIFSGLENLHHNLSWNNQNYTLNSVHLLGAAIDYNQHSKNPTDCIVNQNSLNCSGVVIQDEVESFYNLFNPQDNMLQYSYTFAEGGDIPLGLNGINENVDIDNIPDNYNEKNVKYEIPLFPDVDRNGIFDCFEIGFQGSNHCGYMGARSGYINTPFHDFIINEVL